MRSCKKSFKNRSSEDCFAIFSKDRLKIGGSRSLIQINKLQSKRLMVFNNKSKGLVGGACAYAGDG